MSIGYAGGKFGTESRKRRGSFRTLWLAWRVRDDEELSADDAASTLFRFFRSKHVADLKLFAKLAFILLSLHVSLVVTYALSLPIAHLIANPGVHHSHTDLFEHAVDVLFTRVFPSLFTYVGPAITIYGAIVAWSYLSASKRLGIVDLFACEISTLCRVGTIFDIGKIYVEMYNKGDAAEKHVAAKHAASSQSFVSQEEYFPVFDHNSSDLESLEALVVESITEYYTYMKAARDLLRKLASIEASHIATPDSTAKVDTWHQTVADLIYVLFLGYESGRKAIIDLTEFEPTRAEHTIVILLTELVCYSFLCEFLKHDKVRFSRLQLRQSGYESIVPALIKDVNHKYEGSQGIYWAPAKRTVTELKDRYDAAMVTLKGCIAQQQAIGAATRNVSVTMSRDGTPTSMAEPGSTIVLEVQVQDVGPGPRYYKWTSDSAKIVATDAASATVKLPPGPGETVAFVEIIDDNGGLLSGSIAVPLQTAPDSAVKLKSKTESASADRSGPVFKILTDNGML